MKPEDASWGRTYRANPWRRAFLYLLTLGLTAAAGWCVATPMQAGGRFEAITLLPAAMLLACTAFSYLAATRVRLEVTPEGIRMHTLYAMVETPWSNVASVHLKFLEHGFVTHDPMEGKGAEQMAASARSSDKYPEGIRPLVAAQRFIPLMPFSWHLRHGDFVAQVQQFAPQINLPEAVASPDSRLTRQEKLGYTIAGLVLVLLIVVAITINSAPGAGHGPHRAGTSTAIALSLGGGAIEAARRCFRRRARVMGILLVVAAVLLIVLGLLALVVEVFPP